MATHKEIAIQVEKRLAIPASERLRLLANAEEARVYLSKKLAMKNSTLPYVLSDRVTTTASITANAKGGVTDISPLLTNPCIMLEYIQMGNVYVDNTTKAQWLTGQEQAEYDLCFEDANTNPQIWLNKTSLFIRGINSGTLHFEVPVVLSIANIPKSFEPHLVDKTVELSAEVLKNDSYAQDGKN